MRRLTCRMLAFHDHSGEDRWLEKIDEAIGYLTILEGATRLVSTTRDWTGIPDADDESDVSVLREDRERRINNVCIHKGLFSPGVREIPAPRDVTSAISARRQATAAASISSSTTRHRWVGADPADAMGRKSTRLAPFLRVISVEDSGRAMRQKCRCGSRGKFRVDCRSAAPRRGADGDACQGPGPTICPAPTAQ